MSDEGGRVALLAEFTAVGAEAATELAALVRDYAHTVRAEPGNVAFDAYTAAAEPLHWYVHEIYADQAAFQTHLGAAYGAVFNERIRPLVEGGVSTLTMLTPQ